MLQLHMIPTCGDATLLRFCEAENEINILIDGGNRRNDCIEYLNKLRVSSIDLIIASHLDEDHIRGLRRIADEIEVKELWITDISPLIQPASESLYMMKCMLETSLIVDGKGIQGGNKLAVYDGYEKQIGPFYFQVLSPPKSLHNYLRQPNAIKSILKSSKGQTIKRYVKTMLDKEIYGGRGEAYEQVEQKEDRIAQVIKRFEVKVPQIEEFSDRIERDDLDQTDWEKVDKYYESARSLFNDISIVVSITYNYHGITKQFLFPGDLTNWSLVIAKYPQLIRNRILKVPHHGSEIYCDPEDYSFAMVDNYFNQNISQRLHRHDCDLFDRFWDEQHFIVREMLKGQLSPHLLFHSFPLNIIPLRCYNTRDIYEHLEPERAIIYPLKGKKLPKLGVRNQIINTSKAFSCTYSQQRVDINTHLLSSSCIKCYNCTERDSPVILEW